MRIGWTRHVREKNGHIVFVVGVSYRAVRIHLVWCMALHGRQALPYRGDKPATAVFSGSH